MGSIKVFPENPMTFSGDGIYYPLTVSTQKDGRYASGTVQAYPGFASATARAGYTPNHNGPLFNNLFTQPDVFTARDLRPWFSNDLYTNFAPPKPDHFKNNWLFPTFNPFMNFWR